MSNINFTSVMGMSKENFTKSWQTIFLFPWSEEERKALEDKFGHDSKAIWAETREKEQAKGRIKLAMYEARRALGNEMLDQFDNIWDGQGLCQQSEGNKLEAMSPEEAYEYAHKMIEDGSIHEYKRFYGPEIWYLLNINYQAHIEGHKDYAMIRSWLDNRKKTVLDLETELDDREINKQKYLDEEKTRIIQMTPAEVYEYGKKMVAETGTGAYRRYYGEEIWKLTTDKYLEGKNKA